MYNDWSYDYEMLKKQCEQDTVDFFTVYTYMMCMHYEGCKWSVSVIDTHTGTAKTMFVDTFSNAMRMKHSLDLERYDVIMERIEKFNDHLFCLN